MAIGCPLTSQMKASRIMNPMGIIMPTIAQKPAKEAEERNPDKPIKVRDQKIIKIREIR